MNDSQPSTPSRKFDSLEQEAFLNLWRTYDRLKILEEAVFSAHGLSAQQYNTLRLLAAVNHPLTAQALASRLVSRAPDMTRLLDRLEQRGLITRRRQPHNRRACDVTLTAAGRQLLADLADQVQECHRQQLGHLMPNELHQLIDLLRRARAPHEDTHSPWSCTDPRDLPSRGVTPLPPIRVDESSAVDASSH
ncbi:MAG: hypothetical protein KatS3mg114_1241 [Planctomycetaceae bacterium]|nr:MAG: hypothetical protein KatS3mg114_1241 [Planctomycetaceae bacterium]